MAKRNRKRKIKQKISRKVNKKTEKKTINKYNTYAAVFALIVVIILLVYYFSLTNNTNTKPYDQVQEEEQNVITEVKPETVQGICSKNSECFVTYCKGETKNCINTTQLAVYNKNCRSYSDWVVDRQSPAVCACVQNRCKMIS